MGNRCCDGGNKQADVVLEHPAHTCKATNEISKKYGSGVTKYTCQASVSATANATQVPVAEPSAKLMSEVEVSQESTACVADGKACVDGVDCCGVCAYIGADTWTCQACTALGDECIPMGNRCCDGGNKQADVVLEHPAHTCKATNEISEKYGSTGYTCQSSA